MILKKKIRDTLTYSENVVLQEICNRTSKFKEEVPFESLKLNCYLSNYTFDSVVASLTAKKHILWVKKPTKDFKGTLRISKSVFKGIKRK